MYSFSNIVIAVICSVLFTIALAVPVFYLSFKRRKLERALAPTRNPHRVLVPDVVSLPATRRPDFVLRSVGDPPSGYVPAPHAAAIPLSAVIFEALKGLPQTSGVYSVTFSPETLHALRSGNAHLMQSVSGGRPIAVETNGSIREIATNVSSGLNPAQLVFTAMSTFTGLYFLASINQQLQLLGEDVRRILQILESQDQSKLNIALKFLNNLSSGDQWSANKHQMADHFRDCLLVVESNFVRIETDLKSLPQAKPLSMTEKTANFATNLAEAASNQVRKVLPSKRESELHKLLSTLEESLYRAICGFQICLCIDMVRGAFTSQLSSELERIEKINHRVETICRSKLENALRDVRFTDGEARRERLRNGVNTRLTALEEMLSTTANAYERWSQQRDVSISKLYAAVDPNSKRIVFYLPERPA